MREHAFTILLLGHVVMNAEAIRPFILRRPFEPFVIRMSSGETHEVHHPECVALGKTRLVVSYPDEDKMVHCALLHVTSVESLQSA
jgi:hypothetical protein